MLFRSICSTFNIYGKATCPSKQIPERTLEKATAEVLGLDEFDAEALHDKITAIRAEGGNTLVFFSRTALKPLNGGQTAPGRKVGPRR